MRYRLLGFALLGVAILSLSVDAQTGKTKKTAPAESAATGEIEYYKITEGKNEGKWRFKILSAEGKTIAMPFAQLHWDTKADCLKAIADLKSILNTATPKEIETEKKTEKKTE
jgi:uncharacterized protein YegP (UPF0339 family)